MVMIIEPEKEIIHNRYADLADLHSEPLYRFCRKLAYSKEDADDLFQDTLLKALEKGTDADSMLFTTAIYLWKSQKRKFARRSRIAQIVPLDDSNAVPETESAEDSIIKREILGAARELVDALPEKFRIPVILYYTAELSVADIAAAMKIPEGTVKSRMHKARKQIEKGLIEFGYEL